MIYADRWLEYYDELFPIQKNQEEFYLKLCSEFPAPAKYISVECGAGLVSKNLSEKNIDVTVTDSIPEFISKINISQIHKDNKIHTFVINPFDIARYLGKEYYNVLACCNHRLIFIKDRILVQKLMLDAKSILSKGGYLIIDLLNFSKYDFSNDRIKLPVKNSERVSLHSEIVKDIENANYTLNQYVITGSGKQIDEVKNEVICPVSFETIKKNAIELGFSSVNFYSDYSLTPYDKDSENIIAVLKK